LRHVSKFDSGGGHQKGGGGAVQEQPHSWKCKKISQKEKTALKDPKGPLG